MQPRDLVFTYANEIKAKYGTGHAREHAYRPALNNLLDALDNARAVNDPKRSAHGNPDFVIFKRSVKEIIIGYGETKDIDADLDKVEKTEQMERYGGYNKLFLTNYLEFRFYQNGDHRKTVSIGEIKDGAVVLYPDRFNELHLELQEFLELPPERITSGRRLAEIMGHKGRRIRNNVRQFFERDDDRNAELDKIYRMMQTLLVRDLTIEKFADMYAQTLVYGLFVARYADKTPETFSRAEARDLVPDSNPFLRRFFDHIVGPDFDPRLAYIVDELCEIFVVSDVHDILHRHFGAVSREAGAKDPIIHFYEDFLREYDPAERKRMGAYYTPIPVVRFIIEQVDAALKRDFGLAKGLADTSKRTIEIDHGQKREVRDPKTGRLVKTSIEKQDIHRVQILDPATGTATFLNETIKFIHEGFAGQEGRWPAYVSNDLIPRLHGFELMMAPYVIGHLKLHVTLQETGADNVDKRLGIYLTNALEEGIKQQTDMFHFGLANAVSEESAQAAVIKNERPIMVVIGNPPYSVSSNNRGEHIQQLIEVYKKGLNEKKINLDDDYIKFIRFAENMIEKSGEGIVAMITNNSYLDGHTHRQMRKHLLNTFDKIFVLDLHGNSKKKEQSPDGSKDENVFDIQQGVAIVIMIKNNTKSPSELADLYHSDSFGLREQKFDALQTAPLFTNITLVADNYFFIPQDLRYKDEYEKHINLSDLFIKYSSCTKPQLSIHLNHYS